MLNYSKILGDKVQEIKPSGIRKFFDLAAKSKGVISLGVGEPDFKTPANIREAGIQSLAAGDTKYTANSGMEQLRKEISAYLSRSFELEYNPENELFVTVGGSEAIDLCIRALVNPGDEVLIPEPCFVCYTPIVQLSHGKAVPIATTAENNFKLTAEALKNAITEKTKLLILAYPSNPTGAIMDRQDLEAIAEVLRGTDIMVLSDEIYAEICYGEPHVSIASIDGMKERTILVNGFSKTYSMTGWRLGYVCGPAPVIKPMLSLHQFAIMCAPTLSQHAAIEALKNCDADVQMMREEYKRRRTMMVTELRRIGLDCFEPQGAFYVFPSIKSTGLSSEEFCERLLLEEKIAVIPGNAFGECGEGHVRISYSYSTEHLAKALEGIERFVSRIKQ